MHSETKHKDLIFDVGMHKGEDAEFYLKKGFRVVGFEADPDLIRHCKDRFSREIETGKLTIVEGAILDPQLREPGKKTVPFYKNKNNSVWGTVHQKWAQRNEMLKTKSEIIEINIVDFVECLAKYGIPHYLKIDIEGSDTVCLKSLLDFENKPDFISIEADKVVFKNLLEEFELFRQLGYGQFKLVQQATITSQTEPSGSKEGHFSGHKIQHGSSGLFGTDLPGAWKNREQAIGQYRRIFFMYSLFGQYGKWKDNFAVRRMLRFSREVLKKPFPGWYDTHARHTSYDL